MCGRGITYRRIARDALFSVGGQTVCGGCVERDQVQLDVAPVTLFHVSALSHLLHVDESTIRGAVLHVAR